MPSYKLTYFDIRGMGEAIRMLLTYLGKEFEDNRISMADWPKIKKTIPYGKVPVLEVDGKPLYQSHAICRFLAKEGNLNGDNAWEAAQIDVVAGTLQDLIPQLLPIWTITDPREKDDFIQKVKDEQLTYYFNLWNEDAGKGDGYMANGKLSWADFYFHGWFESAKVLLKAEDILDNYPHLKAGRERFLALPAVKEWIARRPQTSSFDVL